MSSYEIHTLGSGNYSRVETIQGRKLFAEIPYVVHALLAQKILNSLSHKIRQQVKFVKKKAVEIVKYLRFTIFEIG
jgi:hypothetical protein